MVKKFPQLGTAGGCMIVVYIGHGSKDNSLHAQASMKHWEILSKCDQGQWVRLGFRDEFLDEREWEERR